MDREVKQVYTKEKFSKAVKWLDHKVWQGETKG